MRLPPRPNGRAFLVLLLVASAPACGGEAPTSTASSGGESVTRDGYVLRLHRSRRVGERFRLVDEVVRRDEMLVRVNGMVTENVDRTQAVRLATEVEILAVDARGLPTRWRCRIESLERSDGESLENVLRQGQVAEVELGTTPGSGRVTIDGAAASAHVLEALSFVGTLTQSAADADRLFGSERRRLPGSVWQPDFAAVADELGRATPFRLDPRRMTGTVTLVDRRSEGAVDGLVVDVHVNARDAELAGLPEGAAVRRSAFTLEQEGFYPLAPEMPVLRERSRLVLDLRMDAPDARGPSEMTMRIAMTGERRIEPLP